MVSYLDRLILQSVLSPRAPAVDPSTDPSTDPSPAPLKPHSESPAQSPGPADIEVDETRVVSPAAVPQPAPHPPGRGRDVGVAAGEPPAPGPHRRSPLAPMPRSADNRHLPADDGSSREPPPRSVPPVEAATAETPSHGPAPRRPRAADAGAEPASAPSIRSAPPRAAASLPPGRDMLVQRVIDWVAAGSPVPAPEPADPKPEPGRTEGRPRRKGPEGVEAVEPMVEDRLAGHRAPSRNRSRTTGVAVRRPPSDEPLPARSDPVQVRIDSIDLRIDPPRPEAPPPRPPVAAPTSRRHAGGSDMSGGRLARRYIRP